MPPCDATTLASSMTSCGCAGPPLSNLVTSPQAPSRIERSVSAFMRSSSAALARAGRGGAVVVPNHAEPPLVVRHLRDDVHRDALAGQRLPVAGEVGPRILG